jgi:hypothetical protein
MSDFTAGGHRNLPVDLGLECDLRRNLAERGEGWRTRRCQRTTHQESHDSRILGFPKVGIPKSWHRMNSGRNHAIPDAPSSIIAPDLALHLYGTSVGDKVANANSHRVRASQHRPRPRASSAVALGSPSERRGVAQRQQRPRRPRPPRAGPQSPRLAQRRGPAARRERLALLSYRFPVLVSGFGMVSVPSIQH